MKKDDKGPPDDVVKFSLVALHSSTKYYAKTPVEPTIVYSLFSYNNMVLMIISFSGF